MIAPLHNADCLFLSKEDQTRVGYAALAVVEAGRLISLAGDFLAAGYHLEDVSGMVTSDGAVSAYHFAHFDTPGRATVLVVAPLDAPSFPSIAGVYHGAEWHERETRDFFGFSYEGNPNFIPLLLSEDMVDVHPLQKDEGSLASLAGIFSAEGREREIVKKAEGFTLLDTPVVEEAAPAEAVAEEAPKPAAAPEPPKAEALKAEAAPAPAPEKKAEPAAAPKPAPAAEAKPKAIPEPKPAPKAGGKPAHKKGKAVKSGKKGAGNA